MSEGGSVATPVVTTAETIRNFETFFAAHRNSLIRALAMSLNDHALAADAVDEAMTRAVQHWGKVSSYNKPEGWVYRVAMNWATSRFRRFIQTLVFSSDDGATWQQLDMPDPIGQGSEYSLVAVGDDEVLLSRWDYSDDSRSSEFLRIAVGWTRITSSGSL